MRRKVITCIQLAGFISSVASASELKHFNPDTDPSRVVWSQVSNKLGAAPDVRGDRFGIVIKTQTNEYWRLMTAGYRKRAAEDQVKVDIQAAKSESDPVRQLSMMENMIGSQYKAILISPISSSNLQPAIDDAIAANLPVVDIDGAVVDNVSHFVGAINLDMGVNVARWFIRHYPDGGQVAVVKGQAGVFSTIQRTAGFIDALTATNKFEIVATPSGNWDRQQAYDAAIALAKQYPKIVGIYCNNDTMALGVVDAIKSLSLLHQIRVFGTDGTRDAYTSIKADELAGTVDIFPMLTGEIGLDIAERLSVGQSVPRVVITPQALITRDNMREYDVNEDSLRRVLLDDAEHGK